LKIPGVTAVGEPSVIIETAAVCGGSGSGLWPSFLETGFDLFLTAEVKHSILREAELRGCAVIDAGHFATEWPIIPVLAEYIRDVAVQRQWRVDVVVFEGENMPGTWRPCKT
jgi:putative NIF3 family GTP cyclohydrolase 1 type 2